MPTPLDRDSILTAPKVLLHDHLDGGVRPQTVVELAREIGYTELPADNATDLAAWFREAASSGSLVIMVMKCTASLMVMCGGSGGTFGSV